jgi:hypothetical protein
LASSTCDVPEEHRDQLRSGRSGQLISSRNLPRNVQIWILFLAFSASWCLVRSAAYFAQHVTSKYHRIFCQQESVAWDQMLLGKFSRKGLEVSSVFDTRVSFKHETMGQDGSLRSSTFLGENERHYGPFDMRHITARREKRGWLGDANIADWRQIGSTATRTSASHPIEATSFTPYYRSTTASR